LSGLSPRFQRGFGRVFAVPEGVLLRRRLAGVMITQREADGQLALGFVEIDEERQEAWEYAVLVTSLEAEVVTIGQLYRDRGDCENSFDELKNHWGWGGFTTHDLARCRIMARTVALIFNWWNLFVRLADPDHHRAGSRPGRPGGTYLIFLLEHCASPHCRAVS
jgi:hypothetical protein